MVRRTGVFNDDEIDVARELVDENLAKGEDASGYYFLFADGERGIDGYACLGPVPGAHRRCELYWIAVDPDARRRGLGRRASARGRRRWRASSAPSISSPKPRRFRPTRPRGGFYLANGFTLIAEVPDWHDDGDGMAIFSKRL